MIKLAADCFNGVYVVDSFDSDPLSAECFFESLKDLGESEIIFAEVNKEEFNKINEIYGVKA